MATNDVAGIYRANVGACFSTQEIVIICRPVQLVLRNMTKREEGVSFGRTEKLSGESAANGKREADWRRRKKRYHSRCHAQCRSKKKEEEVTRGIQEKEKQTEEGPKNTTKRKEETGTGLTHFGPMLAQARIAPLIASLGFAGLCRNDPVTHTAGGVGCAGWSTIRRTSQALIRRVSAACLKDQLVKINEQICLLQRDKGDASLRVLVTVVLSLKARRETKMCCENAAAAVSSRAPTSRSLMCSVAHITKRSVRRSWIDPRSAFPIASGSRHLKRSSTILCSGS